jgi:hypothetical protein
MPTRVCSQCGLEKDEEEFPLRNHFTKRRQSYCLDCKSKMHASWYERNKDYQKANAKKHRIESRTAAKEYIWNYLLTHPCISCDETDPVVLEFHHRHGKDKAVTEMASAGYPISRIQAEIDKCDVLCANCHRRLTAKERGWFRGLKR